MDAHRFVIVWILHPHTIRTERIDAVIQITVSTAIPWKMETVACIKAYHSLFKHRWRGTMVHPATQQLAEHIQGKNT